MMKRILCFVLSCFMMFQAFPGFAEEKTTETDELYTYIMDVYKGLGVFKNNMQLFENEAVSRAQLAELLYSMFGSFSISSDNQRHYIDVKPNHKAYNEIETVTAMNILSGDEQGFFNPDKNTTYDEAVKVMVCSIGYEDNARIRGGFPAGYQNIANEKKLLAGINDVFGGNSITGRDMAILIYNTLRADVMEGTIEHTNNGSLREIKVEKDTNLLESIHGITIVKGVIECNGFSDIYGNEPCGEGRIKIDGNLYKLNCDINMLGYLTDAYIKDNDNDDYPDTVVHIGVLPDYNEVITVRSDDIISYDSLMYKYGANKKLRISRDTKILYNGRQMVQYDEKLMTPAYGYIEAVSYKGSTYCDVLFIHDMKTIVVNKVSAVDYVVADRYDKENYIIANPDDYGKDIKIFENGKEIQFTQIKKDDVLTVEQSQDGKLVRVFKSKEKVSGVIDTISEDELTVGGEKYDFVPDVMKKAGIRAGEEVTLLLDINNRVAGKSDGIDINWRYGIVLGIYRDYEEDDFNIKIFTHESEEEKYMLAKNIMLDGKRMQGNNSIIQIRIEEQSTPLIRYKCNDDGLISCLDTLSVDTGDMENDALTQMHTKMTCYYNASYYTFGGRMNAGKNTIVFSVNPIPTGEVEEDYRIISPSSITGNKSYSAESFTADAKSLTPDIIFVYQSEMSDKISDTAKFVPVVGVGTAVYDDDIVNVIRGIYDGYEQAFPVADYVNVSDINRGDVIRFGQNIKGLINACEKVYDAKTKSFAYDTNPHNDLGADFYAALANVWNYSDGQIAITIDDSYMSETLPESAKILNLSGTKVYIYEIDSNGMPILTSGGLEDIVGYVNSGEYNSQVLINSHWFGVTELYIIK